MSQLLTERCCRFLKSAAEVPRLYRRTNKVKPRLLAPVAVATALNRKPCCEQEVPVRASAYMDNGLQPLQQLLDDCSGLVSPSTAQRWLLVALSECTQR